MAAPKTKKVPEVIEPLPTPTVREIPQGVFKTPEYQMPVDQPTAKKKKWPWIVAAAAVVVAGGVTAGVLLSKNSKQSQPAAGGITVNW